ncbi:hypothetical protein AALB53_09085 [Lachnospiraceae bacterium 47-T17]
MSNSTKALTIAADVALVCVLIALAFYSLKDARETASTTSELLNETKGEFVESNLTALEGTALSGSTVISAVKKYQSKIPVKVITLNGGNNTYTQNHIFMNTDSSSPGYIKMDASFLCTHEENLNGVVTQINFIEQGVSSGAVDVTNIDDAKNLLITGMNGIPGISASQTWQELTTKLKSELSVSSKTQLAAALGSAYLDTDSWSTLASAATSKIHDLELQVGVGGAPDHDMQKEICYPMAGCVLNFMPTFAVVSVHGNSTKYFFHDNAWYANGELMVTTKFIINENDIGLILFQNETEDTVMLEIYK